MPTQISLTARVIANTVSRAGGDGAISVNQKCASKASADQRAEQLPGNAGSAGLDDAEAENEETRVDHDTAAADEHRRGRVRRDRDQQCPHGKQQ